MRQYKPAGQVSVTYCYDFNSTTYKANENIANMTKRNGREDLFYCLIESLVELNDFVKRLT